MNKNKLGAIVAGVLVGVSLIGLMTCTVRVKTGYVAVQYSTNGGVKDDVLTQGWHVVAPNIKTTEYSIATEVFVMSADERAGSEEDESFKVTCSDGEMNVDFEMQYSFNADDVTKVFEKYRGMDGETVMTINLRSKIKTIVNEVLSNYSVLEAHLEKKSDINLKLTSAMREALKDYGVTVESATLPETRVSDAVQTSIANRTVKAQELEAEKMNQEKIRLEAETKKIKAQGDAEAKQIQAEAEAKANQTISSSITENLLKQQEMEARIKHGWITVSGADTVVTKDN